MMEAFTRHEVLHVKRLFPFPLAAQANGRRREQNGGDQREPDAAPSDHVRPVVPHARIIT